MPDLKPSNPKGEGTQAQEIQRDALQKKKKYTLLHIMFVVQMLFCISILMRSRDVITPTDAGLLAMAPALQSVWAVCMVYHGVQQKFLQPAILNKFPIFWLPLTTVVIQLVFFRGLCWDATKAILEHLPRSTFVGLQSMRVLAVGSLIKWKMGIFPTAFAWLTAFPDMLFGLSAIALLYQADWMENDIFLAMWNLVGFVLIVPIGGIVLQLGMTPTQLYTSKFSNAYVFEYPMMLGPSLVVPILVSWNAIVATWALARADQKALW